uniref:Immunoglobulin I-set domain-containing protein n=1 Tax=Wuchereria bancrofti TaxID=6293 RepID=A0A1I8EMT3_WUCBA
MVYQQSAKIGIKLEYITFLQLLSVITGWEVHILPTAQQLQNRKSDENIAIICSVIGLQKDRNAKVDIKWYREGYEVPINRQERIAVSRMKPLSARLLFIKPTVEDSDTYKCVVSVNNGNDQIKEKSTKISFIQAAEFIDIELEQHPEEGKDAEIICRVHGDPSLEIFWQFEGKTILEGGPRNYEFKDANQILVIPKYDSDLDDGQYTCSAAQFYSFETVTINVTGYARPKITILDGSDAIYGVEGRDFVIQCQAVGKPKPHYQWIKYADGDEEIIALSEKYDINDGTLIIRDLIPADRGTYSCIAKNALDETRLDFNLTVFSKPRLKLMNNLTITRGDTVKLVCEYSGDGYLKAKWLHLGQEWSSRSTNQSERILGFNASSLKYDTDNHVTINEGNGIIILTLTTVDEDDAGQYQCVAENEAGTDQGSVFLSIIRSSDAARIVDHSGTKRALKGDVAVIHCGASAVPEPIWTWTGPSGVIYADGSKYILDVRTVTATLIVRDVNQHDFGKYTCTADNVPPLTPTKLNCHEHGYPNFGICTIGELKNSPPGKLPSNITFYIIPEDKTNRDNGKMDAVNVTFEFDDEREFKFYHLEPRSRYKIRAQAINEAGASELSAPDIIETTDPWAPDTPTDIQYDCSKACKMVWSEPNNRGSPIIAYKLILKEIAHAEMKHYDAESFELDLGADDLKVDLSFLKPLTTYEVKLIAVNDVGSSNAHSIVLNTSEYAEDGRRGGDFTLIIDAMCYLKHHRGFLALICSIFFEANQEEHASKSKNGLQNDRTENNCLLIDERNSSPITVKYVY